MQKDGESEDSKACFDCDNCGKSYSSKGSLRNHKHEHKREEQLKSVKDEAQGEFVESIIKYEVHRPEPLSTPMSAETVLMNPSEMIWIVWTGRLIIL